MKTTIWAIAFCTSTIASCISHYIKKNPFQNAIYILELVFYNAMGNAKNNSGSAKSFIPPFVVVCFIAQPNNYCCANGKKLLIFFTC